MMTEETDSHRSTLQGTLGKFKCSQKFEDSGIFEKNEERSNHEKNSLLFTTGGI